MIPNKSVWPLLEVESGGQQALSSNLGADGMLSGKRAVCLGSMGHSIRPKSPESVLRTAESITQP